MEEAGFAELPDGSFRGQDGTVYRRTSTRLKRRQCGELVASGAAVITNVYPDGMTWRDGPEAVAAWRDIEPRLVEGKPPPVRDLQWIGHLWESDCGAPLLVFQGQH